jgi:2'-5' RNA ligase
MKKSYSCISLLPETALEELEKLQEKIYTLTGSELFRQQRPLHFTVGVGNDLEDIQLQDICLELQSIASRQHPFEISLG